MPRHRNFTERVTRRRPARVEIPPGAVIRCPEVLQVSAAVVGTTDALLKQPPHILLEASLRPALQVRLMGKDGADAVRREMNHVEGLIAEVLRPFQALRFFLASRRLARRVECFPLAPEMELSWIGRRRVLELAIWKYGLAGTEGVETLPGGVLLPTWKFLELEALAMARLLAAQHYELSCWYRRISKGEKLQMAASPSPVLAARSIGNVEIGELIDRWDDRAESENRNSLAQVGQLGAKFDPATASPVYVAHHIKAEACVPMPVPGTDVVFDGDDVFGFPVLLPVTLAPTLDYLDAACQAAHGCTLWDVLLVMAACCAPSYQQIAKSTINRDRVGLVRGFGTLLRRAYIVKDGGRASVERIASRLRSVVPFFNGRTYVSTDAAIHLLSTRPGDIDLQARGPLRPLHIHRDLVLYDLIAAGSFVPEMLAGLRVADSNRRVGTRRFEESVHAELASIGSQPVPSGMKLRIEGDVVTDIDASCVIDGTLVMVDTYSAPVPVAVDRGDHNAIRNRWEHLAGKLDSWKARAARLAATPVGDNYDLPGAGIDQILPVVVTAAVEWIGSRSLWLTDSVPQICTPHELMTLLRSGVSAEVLAKSIPVSRS